MEVLEALYPDRWALLLISVNGKVPTAESWNAAAVERWQAGGGRDEHLRRAARQIASGGNLGLVVPPGAFVLDTDDRASMHALDALLPFSPMQQTARGAHFVVRTTLALTARAKVEIAPGVLADLRVAGASQIVVDPSVHATGARYCWRRELPERVEDLPELPPAIAAALARPAAGGNGHDSEWGEPVAEGSRHETLKAELARWRAKGATRAELVTHAAGFSARCTPPMDESEVAELVAWAATLKDAKGDAPREPGTIAEGDLERAAFSGARLLALLERSAPEPIVPGIPTPGHLALLIAPPFTGKTSLALWNAMARAAGVAPWEGAPARPAGRVLLFSIDEAPEQVARRMRSLSLFHPAGRLEGYAERLVVLGPDRAADPKLLDGLRFDEVGLARVSAWLRDAQREGRPFAEVSIDAYADVLPFGETENSNETATQIGGALERLAVETGAAVSMLHHSGKPKQGEGELPDVTHLSRGASALAAKARVITSLEGVLGMPHLRRIRTKTNLAETPAARLFAVCKAGTEGESILYFRAHDALAAFAPEDLLSSEPISTTELARRIAGVEEGEDPGGEAKRLATQLRERWRERGLAEVRPGPRGAILVSLPGVST